MLNIAEKNWKIDGRDRMSLLLVLLYLPALVMPEDTEELALTLNGKKRKIKKTDFIVSMQASGLENKIIENLFRKFLKVHSKWMEFIDLSFLSDEMKETYKTLITEKLKILA